MKAERIVITGPTACGKSEVAIRVCEEVGGEVISVDSMQIYRGMDIGTAKIPEKERHGIPHHMIDVADPKENYDVVRFQAEALKAEEEVRTRGHIPVFCGGTGFYLQSVLYGIDHTKEDPDAGFRRASVRLAEEKGNEALFQILRETDQKAADVIHPNNVKRVIRAIEFYRANGRSIVDHNEAEREKSFVRPTDLNVLCDDRDVLYGRIEARVDQMMEEGLLGEVEGLLQIGLTKAHLSMQGIGYKELLPYFSGTKDLSECVEQIKTNSRHYAKRQLTWFRNHKDTRWLDIRDHDRDPERIAEEILRRYREDEE